MDLMDKYFNIKAGFFFRFAGMMNKFISTILFTLILFSCTKQQNPKKSIAFNPIVIEANGYDVPISSMASLKVVRAGKPTITIAGKPIVAYSGTNEGEIGKPLIIEADIPRFITPGQDTFLIPRAVPAIKNPFMAGIPEVEIVKDAYIKDQNPQNFSTLSKLQGIKYSSVNCQLQDKSGNIWFCTYGGGVSRYDGKSFTHYTEKEGLSNNRVWSVLQDKNDNLWFGTDGGGVSKFDGKYFTHFTEKEGLINNSVLSILQDKSGNIWFGTIAGVSKYDGKYFTHFTEKEGLSKNTVLSALEDKSGNIWFGTGGGGVSKYDGKSFTNFTEKEGLINNSVLSVFQDSSGNFWFGTYGGVSKYDGKSFTNFTENEGLSYNKIYSILQDSKGALWFGTGGGGITKFNLNEEDPDKGNSVSKSVGRYTHYTVTEGLFNDLVYSILQDKSDNLWFGTNGGVSKYGGKLFTHFTINEGLSNNKVFSVLKDKTGNLWFGTFGGGVSKYDGRSFTNFTEKEGLSNNSVFSIFQDKSGNIWFGTDGGGVSKYDGKSFTNFTTKEGLSNNKVFSILQDKIGNLWFGTYGGGVSKFDGKSFTNFTKKEGLCDDYIVCGLLDKEGNVWFGTDGGGVSKLIPDESARAGEKPVSGKSASYHITNFTKKEGLNNNYVFSILQDNNNNIWFGTGGGGVSKYDGKYFTYFTEKEGLSNDNVLSILQDKSNNLWFATRFGLSRMKVENLNLKVNNPELPLFINYGYDDGFLGIGCTRGAISQDNTGTIWIGTNDRLTAFHPEGDKADMIPPNIQLTGISLFNERINWSNLLFPSLAEQNRFEVRDTSIILGNGVTFTDFNFDETTNWYGIPQNLSLKYNNNFITFSFIGITQIHCEKVKYQYQLVGLDENWSASTLSNEASYSNLSPGTYNFKIKAVNSEGYWSKEFTYSFTIRPPWWKLGWFRLLLAVFIFSSLFGFYRWRISSLKKQQKHLERLVDKETAKVVRQSEELKTINEELTDQKEALELANATKDKFFSIIAHDLRSPFNGFLGLTEIMAEELESLTLADIEDLAQRMKKSATNLFHLLENLLQWSQMQQGIIAFEPKLLPLLTILDESISMSLESAKNKNIVLICDIPQDIEVYADTNIILTIFRNLVSNAIKFTHKGGHVSISARITNDKMVEVSVKDSGIGMSPEMLSNLFRIDVKTNRMGTEGESSTGLGLFLCKDFIERNGGRIWVESELNQGSTFYFALPMQLT